MSSRDEETGADLLLVDPTTGETAPIVVAKGDQQEPERSPDGSTLVYQGSSKEGIPQIFLVDRGRKRHQLTDLTGGAWEPTWSPDGSRIAFAGSTSKRGDSDIFVMDADGRHVRLLAQTPRSDRAPDWSPDGSTVAFHAAGGDGSPGVRGGIWAVSLHDGSQTRLTRNGAWGDEGPAWSPDGRSIAFTRVVGRVGPARIPVGHVWLMRADGTRLTPLGDDSSWGWRFGEPRAIWSPDGNSIAFPATGCACIEVVDVRSEESSTLSVVPLDPPGWCTPGPRWCRSGPSRLLGLSWSIEGILGCWGCVKTP
ncbi:MAG TPA: hypothetical protein VFK59_06725 [Actinomycetota bacterium]|nr:hypothetical protein [Actinomycetota bacterium]